MAKDAIAELLGIMHDQEASPRDRLNAAVSASRVSPLAMPGDVVPDAVQYLRSLIDDPLVPTSSRRESAAALAYYERRCKKAELTYAVPDHGERRENWRRLVNGALRAVDRPLELLGPADTFEPPATDPDRTLAAMMLPAFTNSTARRLRAIDDPGGLPPIASEVQRIELIRPIAEILRRL